jgi:hypothetical protein
VVDPSLDQVTGRPPSTSHLLRNSIPPPGLVLDLRHASSKSELGQAGEGESGEKACMGAWGKECVMGPVDAGGVKAGSDERRRTTYSTGPCTSGGGAWDCCVGVQGKSVETGCMQGIMV